MKKTTNDPNAAAAATTGAAAAQGMVAGTPITFPAAGSSSARRSPAEPGAASQNLSSADTASWGTDDALVYVSSDGARYRIGSMKQNKKTYWRTERWTDEKWEPANSSFYSDYDCAKNEFDAWIRGKSLTPISAVPAESPPSFDYSGLPAQTVAILHSAENMIRSARKEYIIKVADAVGMAHDELCSTVVQNLDNGQFAKKEDTFYAWCDGTRKT